MRRNLWRLATPLLAVCVSFVVVLIIGATSSGSPKPKPSPTPSDQHSADLTINAVAPATPVLPSGSAVTVLNATTTTLRPVVRNHLNKHNSYTKRVPVDSYLVCLHPRGDWGPASGDTLSLSFGSWICKQIGPGQHTVTFHLVPPSASASGVGQ
jgi:hypothetical protein